MTEAQMYRAAADILRRDGWCQGDRTDNNGRHCLMGALDEAIGGNANAGRREWPALWEVTGDGLVMNFNDHHCRSARDAIAALEIAADLCS